MIFDRTYRRSMNRCTWTGRSIVRRAPFRGRLYRVGMCHCKRGSQASMRGKWFMARFFENLRRRPPPPPLRRGDRVRRTLGFCKAMGIDLSQRPGRPSLDHCAPELHEVGTIVTAHGRWIRVRWPSWPRPCKVARENIHRIGEPDPTQARFG